MKYEIASKESKYGEVIDFIKTTGGDTIHIVERPGGYKLRRARTAPWIWDISNDFYTTLAEAEEALLSGEVSFKLDRCVHE